MQTLLWCLAVTLIVLGLAGTVLPALPGFVFLLGGITLAAWIDDFTRVGGWTVALIAALAGFGLLVDYIVTVATARRAGASRLGLIGAAVGTIVGIFFGLPGVLIMPFAGAAAGEFLTHRDALRAGKIGAATWLGLVLGAAAKLALAFAMIGVFLVALIV